MPTATQELLRLIVADGDENGFNIPDQNLFRSNSEVEIYGVDRNNQWINWTEGQGKGKREQNTSMDKPRWDVTRPTLDQKSTSGMAFWYRIARDLNDTKINWKSYKYYFKKMLHLVVQNMIHLEGLTEIIIS